MDHPGADGFDVGARLPLEILEQILSHLAWRVQDLASCALVSRAWNTYATPLLYARLYLRNQRRVREVLASLDTSKHLARLVKILEIRVWPFGLQAEALEDLEASLLRSLQHCQGLEELYWTRNGSLTDRVTPFLPYFASLNTLELTGSSRFYTPADVTKFLLAPTQTPNLRHFSLVLPDRKVVAELPEWASQLGSKLESFSILCQVSSWAKVFSLLDADRAEVCSFHTYSARPLSPMKSSHRSQSTSPVFADYQLRAANGSLRKASFRCSGPHKVKFANWPLSRLPFTRARTRLWPSI